MSSKEVNNYHAKDNSGTLNIRGTIVKTKKIKLCSYCMQAYHQNKLMKCSNKLCSSEICKSCATLINDKPFCNNCIIDIVKNKSWIIVTKGDL